jgi:hypothetical protein
MDIHFEADLIKALVDQGAKSPVFKANGTYFRDKTIDSRFIEKSDMKLIRRVAGQPEFSAAIENRRVIRKLNAIEAMGKVTKSTVVKRLELLADAIRDVILETPRTWLFGAGETILPWFVIDISFNDAERGRYGSRPANVSISMQAMSRGEVAKTSVWFERQHLPSTVEDLLDNVNMLLATDKLIAEHEEDIKRYEREAPRTGEQFLARGRGALASASHWRKDVVSLERNGEPSKVVMDDDLDRKSESDVANAVYWTGKPGAVDDDDSGEAPEVQYLPTHPVCRVFSLATHEYVDAHISCLEPYEYDDSIITKLVLPDEHKRLIDALTSSAINRMSDIIRGKAQGIIVLCSGVPGTGKTLTAEVYSEAAKRPLYIVQCSQLGTDEVALEKSLGTTLDRATRWRAIMLIDEADVYIHERGDDIHQNAIVGVFLRLLEYYNGILFLTTNRATVIDDAILSRATAHVKYDVPEGGDRVKLWDVLLEQYGVRANAKFIKAAIETFPDVSGRSIRQIIRLGLIVSKAEGSTSLTLANLKQAAKFHDFTERDANDV